MDPSQNPNFFPNYNFPNQAQNPNMQPPNPNIQCPENPQNPNFFPNYNFPNQAQNPNIRPPNPNIQCPENPQNAGMQPNFGSQYMMPPNFGMQYPYNHPYMPYGYQPVPGNSYVPAPVRYPNSGQPNEPNTPRFSSGSSEFPEFSTQISMGNVDGDTPVGFVAPTQQSAKRSGYDTWSTEENKSLLTGYFHFSNDSELGSNQKGDTFWGKITDYVNENFQGGKQRSVMQCKSHFRTINKKICSFIGYYSKACRVRCSGWSDDDYIAKGLELYQECEGNKFSLLEEWKLVRDQPRYMPGANDSPSSGSKRKSGGDDVDSSAPSIVRPEGRDATKKKARASSNKSSTSRKSKVAIEEELSNLAQARENLEQSRASTASAMLEYARVKKMEMFMSLKSKEDRDAIDENMYKMLLKELFEN